MEIRVLKYFVTIAQELNMTKAALILNVSQPALSKQIKELETELNTQLFERSHRQLKLTQEGHYLYERAQQIISLVDKTTYHLQKNAVISGTIDIGAGESYGLSSIMESVQYIINRYPEVKVNFRSGDSNDIIPALDAGLLEFGIIMENRPLPGYKQLILPESNRWGAIMRNDEPLAQQTSINPADLIGRPLLASKQSMALIENWSGALFDQLKFIGSFNLAYNASLLVKTGGAILLAYEHLIDTSKDSNLVFRPFSPEISDPNVLIWKKNANMPNVSKLFLDTLKKQLSDSND